VLQARGLRHHPDLLRQAGRHVDGRGRPPLNYRAGSPRNAEPMRRERKHPTTRGRLLRRQVSGPLSRARS
jgi:hypothetical protein